MCDELPVQCVWHLYIWCSINANIITSGKINSDHFTARNGSTKNLINIVPIGQERDQPKVFGWVMEKLRIMELSLTIFSPPNFIWLSLYEVRILVNEFLK